MIVYRKGDVVAAFKNGEIDVLVHGVNCQGKMNSGIAKQIRAEFPQAFNEYIKICSSDFLGRVQYVHGGNNKYIVNAFTQDDYGYDGKRFCSYDAIDRAMEDLIFYLCEGDRVAMPKIGAGLGGGDWKVIEAIINSRFPDREVYVYEIG